MFVAPPGLSGCISGENPVMSLTSFTKCDWRVDRVLAGLERCVDVQEPEESLIFIVINLLPA